MNILILSGSPRKKGLVSQMLAIMREEAEKRGDEVETIRTNDLNIKPCIGFVADKFCQIIFLFLLNKTQSFTAFRPSCRNRYPSGPVTTGGPPSGPRRCMNRPSLRPSGIIGSPTALP